MIKHRLQTFLHQGIELGLSIIILLILGYGALGFLCHDDAFIYDDHGFHYATFLNAVMHTIPQEFRINTWNSSWFAGIPELQFYPPGFVIIGAFIYYAGLGLISPPMAYQLLVILAFLLPAIGALFLVRKSGFTIFPALVSGVIILLYDGSASGVSYGVLFGLINSRLAFGFIYLLLFAYLYYLQNHRNKWAQFTVILLTGLLLVIHPYHIFLPVIALFSQILTWSRIGLIDQRKVLKRSLILVLIGVGLAAFWWIPLLAYSDYMAKMQVWTGTSKFNDLIYGLSGNFPEKYLIILYCMAGVSLLVTEYKIRTKAILAGFLFTPILMLLFLLFVRLVLVGLFKIYSLDPWRLQDDFYFSLLLTAGIGLYFPLEWVFQKIRVKAYHNWQDAFGLITALCVFFVLSYGGITVLSSSFRYQGFQRFGFFNQARTYLHLDELWGYLHTEDTGRVMFTSSRIGIPGLPDIFHTHVLALTPWYTGRPILGAVNEPFYATAAYYYFGHKPPVVIRQEADALQNKSLFGIDWEQMSPVMFWNYCRRYNATTIVVNSSEDKVLDWFNKSSWFQLINQIGPFSIFRTVRYTSEWTASSNSQIHVKVQQWDNLRIRLQIDKIKNQKNWLFVKMGYYPRWRAYVNGKPTIIESDELGMMRVLLPEGDHYPLDIRYELTAPHVIGILVSVLSLFLAIGITLKPRFKFKK